MSGTEVETLSDAAVDLLEKETVRVLLVDDEESLLIVAEKCLQMEGPFEVETALSAEEAFRKLEKKKFDAIVSDYQMPVKDGLAFLKELRDSGANTPFIMFTGRGREEIAIKALNLGADQYINKLGDPATVYNELAHGIRLAVSRKSAEDALAESEHKYRTLLENLPQKIFLKDRSLVYVSCNENYARDLRIKPNEIMGKTDYDFFSKELAEKYRADDQTIMESEETQDIEEEYIQNGQRVFVHTIKTPVKGENDNVVGVLGIFWDVTERRLMEQKYTTIIKTALDGFWINDSKGRFIAVNDAYCEMIGHTHEELLSMSIPDIEASEKPEETAKHIKKILKEGYDRFETRHRRKDGTAIDIEVSATYYPAGDGQLVVFIRDVTERKKAEEALRVSEEKHRVISGSTADFVFSCVRVDEQGFAVDWMAGATEKTFGYSAKEIRDEGCWKFTVQPQDLRTFKEKVTGLKPGQSSVCELRITHKDGSTRWINVSSRVTKDSINPTKHRLFGTCEDITERKRGEEALRESEEKWRSLAENAPSIIMIVDRLGTIQFINHTVVDARPEEIVGKSMYDFIGPEHHNLVNKTIEQVFQTGEGGSYEISGVGPKGSVSWYATQVGPTKQDGQTVSVTLITTDITARRNAEKALKESQQKFEAIFRDNPEAAVYVDMNSRVLDVNDRFCRLFGYSAEEVKGKHINELVVPDDRLEEARELDKAASKGYASYDTVRKRKDGSLLPVTISAASVSIEGKLLGNVGTYKDITERKILEEKLQGCWQLDQT